MKKLSKRMRALRKAGLIGCLNGSGITSENYKRNIKKAFNESQTRQEEETPQKRTPHE